MKYLLTLCFVAFLCTVLPANDQTPQSLARQYSQLSDDVEVIDGYRMVKAFKVDQFWKAVHDSLQHGRVLYATAQKAMSAKNEEIKTLKAGMALRDQQLADQKKAGDTVSLLGLSMDEKSFVASAGILLLGLAVLLGLVFITGKAYYGAAREHKKMYENLHKEFEHYKHLAIEKEIKLSRELQTERNKLSELKKAS